MKYLDVAVFLLLAILFITHPGYDIAFSQLFYQPQSGWLYSQQIWVQFFYHIVPYLTIALLIILPSLVALSYLKKAPQWIKRSHKAASYLLLVLILGPGLLVNNILKNHWDRARPHQITEFNGSKQHSAAFVISDQCESNCSFVSGHASIGYFFMAFYWLFQPRRKSFFITGFLLGSLIGMARIIQGDHFLSDVIFSFFSVYFVAKILAWIIKPDQQRQLTSQAQKNNN